MAAESRLESRRDPLFEEPSRVVVFDLAFVKERFFDIQSGSLIEKVSSHDQKCICFFNHLYTLENAVFYIALR